MKGSACAWLCGNIRGKMTAADSWASLKGPSLGADSDWGAWRDASGAEGQMQLNTKTFISRIFPLPSELTVPPHTTFSFASLFTDVHNHVVGLEWFACYQCVKCGTLTVLIINHSINIFFFYCLHLPSTAPPKSQYCSEFSFLPVYLCRIIQTFSRKTHPAVTVCVK